MPDSQAIVQSAQLASFTGLSNCLAVLFATRQSLGDMVFTFAEGGEERAHRYVVGCAAIVQRQTALSAPAPAAPRLYASPCQSHLTALCPSALRSLVVCLRSPYLSALVTMTRMAPASSSAPLRLSDPLSRENFVLLLHWMYTGALWTRSSRVGAIFGRLWASMRGAL